MTKKADCKPKAYEKPQVTQVSVKAIGKPLANCKLEFSAPIPMRVCEVGAWRCLRID